MQSIYQLVETQFEAVNTLILQQLHSQIALVEDISQYLATGGGKRVRPLVVLLIASALDDADNPCQVELATAIEFLHTATLLHDDVVDVSSLRRGKPTANANWGNASSVLVGDFVYSRAFQLMVSVGNLKVMQVLSDTTVKIAEGEVQQLAEIGNLALDEPTYFDVIERKTAQLFAGACESAALVAGADTAISEAARDYGKHLGLAFQLVDDYLDYAGDTEALGKNVGDDLAEGKLTLPLIEALRQTRENDAEAHTELSTAIANKDLSKISTIVEIVRACHALDYTREAAKRHAELAASRLEVLPSSPLRDALSELCEFVVQRSF
ncbi:MAG: polyprenyl synthetase family protein [Gammaproteobacteria bacterium]|nr:polyprenyl synthetase family protein [Gammaproteobacteria bacterium]